MEQLLIELARKHAGAVRLTKGVAVVTRGGRVVAKYTVHDDYVEQFYSAE